MEIHQILVSASPGDAVTNSALEYQSLLREISTSEIFAYYRDPALGRSVLPLDSYKKRPSARSNKNVLIYHASIGDIAVQSFLMETSEPLVLVYHNMTPGKYFSRFEPSFARLLDEGRAGLGQLRSRVILPLALSEFNARDLESLGYDNVQVSPLIVDVSSLRDVDPDPQTLEMVDSLDGPLVLFVGQILPHKRPDLLLAAYHVLSTYLDPQVHLFVAGASRVPAYGRAIEQYQRELNLHRGHLTGMLPIEKLAAMWRRADLFVTASEHEGFCIPLVEAMAFGVPVVARSYAAIPETLGGTGLLLPQESGPAELAEAMAFALRDHPVREMLVAPQADRLKELDPQYARQAFLQHMLAVV